MLGASNCCQPSDLLDHYTSPRTAISSATWPILTDIQRFPLTLLGKFKPVIGTGGWKLIACCVRNAYNVEHTIKHLKTFRVIGSLYRHPRRHLSQITELCAGLSQRRVDMFDMTGTRLWNQSLVVVLSTCEECAIELRGAYISLCHFVTWQEWCIWYQKTNTIIMLVSKFSMCSHDVKKHLFQTFCVNIYCAQLRSDYTETAMSRLRIAYINCLRRFLGYWKFCRASGMFVECEIMVFCELVRNYI